MTTAVRLVRSGLTLPIFGELADPRVVGEVAVAAEEAGFDGVFVWDHVLYRRDPRRDDADGPADVPVADPWVTLATIADRTSTVRLGPLVTPLPRRRVQVVARQSTSLDVLSDGRLVLGVGLGGDAYGEFSRFGDEADPRERAGILDESLATLRGLWSGEHVTVVGEHVVADGVRFLPRPVQRPHPRVWAAGRWPNRAPLVRASRLDGFFPIDLGGPADLARVVDAIVDERGDLEDFDVVGQIRPGEDAAPWVEHGATWVLTTFDPWTITADAVLAAVSDGPPGGR